MVNATQQRAHASQEFVQIEEIRDGIIITKNKGLRALLMTSSMNFALKSSDEQDAIIAQFQNMLNTMDFTVQIYIQSRKKDINPYLDLLGDQYKKQSNELLRIQTQEYIEFIKSLVENTDIVEKIFYIVIPYDPILQNVKAGFIDKALSKITGQSMASALADDKFEEYRTQLFQRVEVIKQGLSRFGLRAVELKTEEVIELFYNLYNPGQHKKGAVPGLPIK